MPIVSSGKIYNTAGTSRERQTKYESTDDFPNVINTTSVYDSKDFKARFRSGIYVFKRTPPNNSLESSEKGKKKRDFVVLLLPHSKTHFSLRSKSNNIIAWSFFFFFSVVSLGKRKEEKKRRKFGRNEMY